MMTQPIPRDLADRWHDANHAFAHADRDTLIGRVAIAEAYREMLLIERAVARLQAQADYSHEV